MGADWRAQGPADEAGNRAHVGGPRDGGLNDEALEKVCGMGAVSAYNEIAKSVEFGFSASYYYIPGGIDLAEAEDWWAGKLKDAVEARFARLCAGDPADDLNVGMWLMVQHYLFCRDARAAGCTAIQCD